MILFWFACLVRRAEHRAAVEDDAPVKSLPFYGGAKGKYLLIHGSGRTSITHRNPSFYGLKGDDDDEEDVGMEGEGEPDESESSNSTSGSGGPDESVSVGLPPDNASVAEAKPVGLAIAGPGGVASSRPVGTAVVGPGGLALAKPVATAIAGVQGSEQLVGLPGAKKRYDKPKGNAGIAAAAAAAAANKTRQNEENVVAAAVGTGSGRSNDHHIRTFDLQYDASAIPQAYNVLYIPLYLPVNN